MLALSENQVSLVAGLGFGALIGIPPVAALLLMVATWLGGALWYPLLAIPSLLYLRRHAQLGSGSWFILGAVTSFTLLSYLLVRSNHTEAVGLTALASWVGLCLGSLSAPVALLGVGRFRTKRAA